MRKQKLFGIVIPVVAALAQMPVISMTASAESTPVIYYRGGENDFYTPEKNLDYYINNYGSDDYVPELSHMLMCLSWAAYNDTERESSGSPVDSDLDGPMQAVETDEEKRATNIYRSLESLGFEDITLKEYYEDPQDARYGENNCAYTMAHKKLDNTEKDIVIAAFRGSYGAFGKSSDWTSNFLSAPTNANNHAGFEIAARKALTGINGYLAEHSIDDSVLVFTGHSRGAAVSNLVSAMYIDNGKDKEDVYSYNFAVPNNTQNMERLSDYEDIFNICNTKDFVPYLPAAERSWGKYGRTLAFTEPSLYPSVQIVNPALLKSLQGIPDDVDTLTHMMAEYERNLRNMTPLSGYKEVKTTWAKYTQVGGDFETNTGREAVDKASAWALTVVPGTDPVTSLNVKVNGHAAKEDSIETPAISGGEIVVGVVVNHVASEIENMAAVANGTEITALAR